MKLNWQTIRLWPYEIKKQIFDTTRTHWSFFYMRTYFFATLFLILINFILIFIFQSKMTTEQIALHYNVDFGVNLYGDSSRLYFIPVIGVMIFIFNFSLVINTNKQEKFIIHTLLGSALIVNLILLISQTALYFYNLR